MREELLGVFVLSYSGKVSRLYTRPNPQETVVLVWSMGSIVRYSVVEIGKVNAGDAKSLYDMRNMGRLRLEWVLPAFVRCPNAGGKVFVTRIDRSMWL